MKCPHCGAENPDNSIFCKKCNGWILAKVYVKPEESAVPAPEPEAAKPVQKTNWKIIVPTVAALCLVILLAVWLIPNPEPPAPATSPTTKPTLPPTTTSLPATEAPDAYIAYKANLEFLNLDGNLSILIGDQILHTDLAYHAREQYTVNLDQTAAVLQLDDGSLHYVGDGQIHKFADSASNYLLSVHGGGVAYCDENDVLWLYQADTQTNHRISESDYIRYVISPDGKTVAYVDAADDTKYIHCWCEGQDVTLCELQNRSVGLVSVSNGGSCVYYLDGSAFCGLDANGVKTGLAVLTDSIFKQFTLNADHTQILYITDHGYFLSENGSTWIKLYNEEISLKVPRLVLFQHDLITNFFCSTYGFLDLRNALYTTQEIVTDESGKETTVYTLWALQDDKLVPVQNDILLSFYLPDIYTVFLQRTDGHFYRWDMESGSLTLIAKNANWFRYSDDGSQVFYVRDGMLYRCNGMDGSNAEMIAEFSADQLTHVCNGYIYWLIGQELLSCAPDGTVSLVMTGVSEFDDHSSSEMYVYTQTDIYIAEEDGTFRRLEN